MQRIARPPLRLYHMQNRICRLLAVLLLPAIPWMRGTASAAEPGRSFWSFQPPKRHALPTVRDTVWPSSAVDSFLLARLEKEGLHPAPPADRTTLLRRVTIDL